MDNQLLIRFFNNSCTEEEVQLIQQFILSSKENAELFFSVESCWSLKKVLKYSQQKEVEKAYNQLMVKIVNHD